MKELSHSEQKVAKYILSQPQASLQLNINELGKKCTVSEATIVRMSKRLGYKGFYQMKLYLAQSLTKNDESNEKSDIKEEITSLDGFYDAMIDDLQKIKRNLDDDTVNKCAKIIASCNTLHIIASGNTIPIVLDFAFRLSRIGVATTSSISDELSLATVNIARYGDIVMSISHTGGSAAGIKALEIAKKKGLSTIAITDIQDCPLNARAEYRLCTGVDASRTYVFGAESHTYISTILDVLLFEIAKEKRTSQGISMFLSETKMVKGK
jgi:DNA-binding MurR/RpiR family transcriptional regulator